MASMLPHDLFLACVSEEGSSMSAIQNLYTVGSVLSIDPAKLFQLEADQAPGLLTQNLLQVTLQIQNISPTVTTAANINIVLSNDTIASTDANSQTTVQQGFITNTDVMNANSLPAQPSLFANHDIYGGKFLDKLGNFAKKSKLISTGLNAIGTFFPEVAPISSAASRYAKSKGYGPAGVHQMEDAYRKVHRRAGRY